MLFRIQSDIFKFNFAKKVALSSKIFLKNYRNFSKGKSVNHLPVQLVLSPIICMIQKDKHFVKRNSFSHEDDNKTHRILWK